MKSVLPVSVLMSVYDRERPEFLDAALQSIVDQTHQPAQVVLVEDGPINARLMAVIERFETMLPLSRLHRSQNRGLGPSLQEGLAACDCGLVARMDSDDIARPSRLVEQTQYLEKIGADIIGSSIEEFRQTPGDLAITRQLPLTHELIYTQLPRRNCFNHMTVLFRRDAVLQAGSYRDEPYFEDYGLWLRMRAEGARFGNLADVHVDARVGDGFAGRRSGLGYVKRETRALHSFWSQGLIGFSDLAFGVTVRTTIRLLPKQMLPAAYNRLLRKKR